MTDTQRREQVAQMSKTIFSYCLSRTSSYIEAEDLSQEILLECCRCIVNLRDEKAFYAFVWRTADNILKKWYRKKNQLRECEMDDTFADESYYEIEERAKTDEQLALVRRELALIRSNYRKAMIEYYINERSVKEIAQLFSISESMVKYLLFQSRKRIKEGVYMERNYGEFSYNPVNLEFRFWGGTNHYYNMLNGKIAQNILMACYYEKQNEEQISIQTGIPTAYLEDELQKLLHYGLLTEKNGFYLSDIVILTKKELQDITKAIQKPMDTTIDYVTDFVDGIAEQVKSIGFYGNDMPINSLKWLITSKLLHASYIEMMYENRKLDFPTDIFDQCCFRWLIETTPTDSLYDVGMSGMQTTNGVMEFWDMGINGDFIHHKVSDVSANMMVTLTSAQPESENDKLICTELIESGIAVKTEDGIKPNCPCFTNEQAEQFISLIRPAAKQIYTQAEKRLGTIQDTISEHTPKRLLDYAMKMSSLVQLEEIQYITRLLCEKGWLLPYKGGMLPTTVIYLS